MASLASVAQYNPPPSTTTDFTASSYATNSASLDSLNGLTTFANLPYSVPATVPFSPDLSFALPPTPSPTFTPALVPVPSFPTPVSSSSLPPTPASSSSSSAPTPAAAPSGRSHRVPAQPGPTGFRSTSQPLIALDAPVRSRKYLTSSRTSKKGAEVVLPTVNKKRKRSASESSPDVDDSGGSGSGSGSVGDEEEVDESLTPAERTRLLNTIAARKSRFRKQQRVEELERCNGELVSENADLKARVKLLEGVMRALGVNVPE